MIIRQEPVRACVPLLLAVGFLLLAGAVGADSATLAQEGDTRSSFGGEAQGQWVEVEVSAHVVNEARRAAGRSTIEPKRGRETITLRYQRPVERRWSFNNVLRQSSGSVLSFGSMTSNGAPRSSSDGETVIEGLTLDDNGDLAGTVNIPSDPHGAVGTNHLCHVVNVSIQCQTKDGTSVLKESLENFFGKGDDIFDPRIVYDPRADRFVVVVLNKTDTGTASENVSELLMAVSSTGDPSGSWSTQAVDMKQTISVDGTNTECWMDFPSLSVDEEAIYVTGAYFAFDSESKSGFCDVYLSTFDQGLYSGNQSNRAFLGDPNEDFIQGDFDGILQPATIHGTGPGGDVGTWLFQYSGLTSNTGDGEFWLITRVDDPLGSPSFSSNLVSWEDVDETSKSSLPDAPQPSVSTKIETNDRRSSDLDWRDGTLWGTTTVIPPSGTNSSQATAFYGEVDVSTLGQPVPGSNGYLGGEDVESGAHTYYPAITIDEVGNVVFSLSLSASSTYVGTYMQTISAQSGALSETRVAKEGVAEYVRTLNGDSNRWGDYSDVVRDPTDGSAWVINQAALTTGSCTTTDGEEECGRWGVFLVQFSADVLPVEIASFEASADGRDAVLAWQTASETNNAGFTIRHQAPNSTRWSTVAFVEGAGTTTASQTYRYRVHELDPGRHRFRLVQTDTDGTTTPGRPVEVTVRPEGEYALQAPRPNPTSDRSRLRLSVRSDQSVRVSLYNTLGQRIRTLLETSVNPADPLEIHVDGTTLSPGLYFVRVAGDTFEATRRLTVVR